MRVLSTTRARDFEMASGKVHAVIANSFSTLHTTARRVGIILLNDKIMEGAEQLNFIVHTTVDVRRDFQLGMVEYCLRTTGPQNCYTE